MLSRSHKSGFDVIHYGQPIYIHHMVLNRRLWSRGFIDKRLYLSSRDESESVFTIEPKKGLYGVQDKNRIPVVFGAEVLIKHTLSDDYISINSDKDIPVLEFSKKEDASCYFEFKPTRSFESNGNAVTVQSLFMIEHSEKKMFISCIHEQPADEEDNERSVQNSESRVSTVGEIFAQREKRSEKDESLSKMDFTKKARRKESPSPIDILPSSIGVKRSVTLDEEPASPSIGFKSISDLEPAYLKKVEPIQSFLKDLVTESIPTITNRQRSEQGASVKSYRQDHASQKDKYELPIYSKLPNLISCHIENEHDPSWRFQLCDLSLKTPYLENNEFIYFTYSQENQVIAVDMEKQVLEASLVKVANDHESEYLCSSIFLVEVCSGNTGEIYLRHYLTGLYFSEENKPLSSPDKKLKITLRALLPPKKKQLPPFEIKRELTPEEKLERERRDKEHPQSQQFREKSVPLHGYWINKVPKHEISEIMSLQNVNRQTTITYLTKYLTSKTRRRQNILREFQFIPYLIKQVITDRSDDDACLLEPSRKDQKSGLRSLYIKPSYQTAQRQSESNQSEAMSPVLGPQKIYNFMMDKLKEDNDRKERNQLLKQSYQLLFFIIKNNSMNKKKCLNFLDDILKEPNKELILDLLTELLSDNSSNPLEKYIVSDVIEKQLKEFINNQKYSISFMRIFRVFCGSEQPCVRNQKLLFSLFFWGSKGERHKKMTESSFLTQKTIQIPQMYKFRFFEKDGDLFFYNGSDPVNYDDLKDEIKAYIRQYYYLLSDCMNNNYELAKKFKQEISMSLLLKLMERKDMKGPGLAMLCNAYLKPQRNYRSNIFHKDYDKICEKGSLIAMTVGPDAETLLAFIMKELNENDEYSSTTFRILLNVLKMTIDNGYWSSFDRLLQVRDKLAGINQAAQRSEEYHSSYQQKVEERNLMKSKITSISILISLIQMQVSLTTSNLVSGLYEQQQIHEKLQTESKELNANWKIDKNLFRISSTKNPELMRKSLLLLYKIYNLPKILYKTYEEARKQNRSALELKSIFYTLQSSTEQMSIDVYFSLISSCVKDIVMEQLMPTSMSKGYRNVESIFKYKPVNQEVQIMIYKLGIHDCLIKDIKRYNGLRHKQKESEEEIIYWKLLLVYAMIRNNLKLRDIVIEHRSVFISILESDKSKYKYYVAADILEEIYRNNRKLIISDTAELEKICVSIGRMILTTGEMDLKCCKMVNLLGIFIETGNRKIVENHQTILKNIFTKDVLKRLRGIMGQRKSFREQHDTTENKEHFRDILQILIYDLMNSLGQKKLLLSFEQPNNTTIHSILLGIGNRNWNLKSKVFSCINFHEQMPEKLPIQFMRLILYDLNIMCESIKTTSQQTNQQQMQSSYNYNEQMIMRGSRDSSFALSRMSNVPQANNELSKQVKIYISNMIKILETIAKIFEYIITRKQLKSQESEEVILIIKIIERLFVIKDMCPLVVRKKIDALQKYIEGIQNIINKTNIEIDLIEGIKEIRLEDFDRNEIKEKLPLLYNEKIKIKLQNKEKQKKEKAEEQLDPYLKLDIAKMLVDSDLGKVNKQNEAIQMPENDMQELKNFLGSMSTVNKNDPTVLSDNIKEFLANFIGTSFLSNKKGDLLEMQNKLLNYEIPGVICSIMEEPFKQRYKMFHSVFALANLMLEGGHTSCQEKFLQMFREDSKNHIFQNIHSIMYDSLKTIEFYYMYEEDPTIKSYEMMLQLEEVFTCKEERRLSCKLLCEAFRFLQLLCENDNHQMKDYIFNQTDKEDHIKYMSKNFVECAQDILGKGFNILSHNVHELGNYPDRVFEWEIQQNIFPLPSSIIDFLIEVCQIPAEQNQLYLCRTDFFKFVWQLMKLRKSVGEPEQTQFFKAKNKENIFFEIQRKLVILFRGLLEQNSKDIVELMSSNLNIEVFQFLIKESLIHGGVEDIEKLKQMLNSPQLITYLENIVDVLIVKRILRISQKFSFDPDKMAILDQLNNSILSINVDFKGHLLTVYFPYHPLFSLLTKKTKDYLLNRSANLNTRKEKVTEYIISRHIVYEDINQEKEASKRLMNDTRMSYLFNFTLFLCFVIILLLVLFYSVGKSGAVLDIFETGIIKGISYMELIVSAIYTVLLGLNNWPFISEKMKTNIYIRNKRKQQDLEDLWDKQEEAVDDKGLGFSWRALKALYFDEPDSAHAVMLLLISIYSCFFQVRAYSFAMLFVFAKFELLESIFKAIRLTWQQLAFVCLLALAFSFIFGFITLNNYIGPLYDNQEIDIDIDHINEHCNSIITCIGSLYTQKIIGQSVSDSEEYNYGRFVSDLIYWGFFQILLSNMIAAIIIDKFAEQRNAKEKIYHERYSKCYICFADRNILERRGEDFYSHVTNVHSLWNYFYYMYTLEHLKHITQFTGIEYWINRQIKNNLIDWLPIDDSLKQETGQQDLQELLAKLRPYLMGSAPIPRTNQQLTLNQC